jgi:hypothetical protein
MPPTELLFLDTSIHIARLLHGPAQKARVEARAGNYLRSSGLVCRQEFKRRILKTAEYLLGVLDERKGYENAHAYMTRLIQNQYQKRRATICLHLLAQATGNADQDKTDRLRVKLRTLILTGLKQFDGWLDRLAPDSGCGCGRCEVRQVKKPKSGRTVFEFGGDKCSQLGAGQCGIVAFLRSRTTERVAIRTELARVAPDKKSAEIQASETFLTAVESDPQSAPSQNPCLVVGDLIIALESAAAGAKAFYTMNGRESQYLCKALGQTLIVRKPDEQQDDVICPGNDPANWPDFG